MDLEKAFDKVPRKNVWGAFLRCRVPEKFIDIYKELHRETKAVVRSGGIISEGVTLENGESKDQKKTRGSSIFTTTRPSEQP